MQQLIYNHNLQPHEIAANKLYFSNMMNGTNWPTFAIAEKQNPPVINTIIKKLRPYELDALIQIIQAIR